VKQLERQLGLRLIERSGRKVRATAAGGILLEQARRIDGAVTAAIDALADQRGKAGGRVVLAAGSTASIYLLPPILGALKRAHPLLELAVRTGSTVDIMHWIDDNSVDVAIVTRPPPTPHLMATAVHADELVLIAPARERLASDPLTAASIACLPLITPPSGGGARVAIDPWFEASGLTCKPLMEFGSVEAIKRVVSAGLGYGIVPRLSVIGDPSLNDIRAYSLFPQIFRELALVIRQDKHMSHALREVMRAFGA
jgi:DNA-binding transcriptional LysR family regulator